MEVGGNGCFCWLSKPGKFFQESRAAGKIVPVVEFFQRDAFFLKEIKPNDKKRSRKKKVLVGIQWTALDGLRFLEWPG